MVKILKVHAKRRQLCHVTWVRDTVLDLIGLDFRPQGQILCTTNAAYFLSVNTLVTDACSGVVFVRVRLLLL